MQFWLRLSIVLAVPLVAFAWFLDETVVWGGVAGLVGAYLGVGWAINAFFS